MLKQYQLAHLDGLQLVCKMIFEHIDIFFCKIYITNYNYFIGTSLDKSIDIVFSSYKEKYKALFLSIHNTTVT